MKYKQLKNRKAKTGVDSLIFQSLIKEEEFVSEEQKRETKQILIEKYKNSEHPKRHKNKKSQRLKRKQRIRDISRPVPKQYKVYIASEHWVKRKDMYFRNVSRKCAVCGSSKYINLHHAYYGEYGNERDEDLVPLCREHHEMFHEQFGKTKKDMRKDTNKFIEEHYDPFKYNFN